MRISFNLDKKLIFLVIVVSVVSLSITAFLSFNYAEQILKEKDGNLLLGESNVRGDSLRFVLEERIKQNQMLADDPMIRNLVVQLNEVPEENYLELKENKRRDFLTQIQAFQNLVGFSIGLEDVKIIGKNGKVFFSLGTQQNNDFGNDPLFQKGIKNSIIDFEPTDIGKKMIVASPIFSENNIRSESSEGVLISRMRTTTIDNILLDRSGLGESGEVYIVNDGFLMLSESRFLEDAIFHQKVDTLPVQKCFRENQNFLGFYLDYRGINIYGSSYCAADLGFVLLAEIDEEETIKPVLALQEQIIQTGILITSIMIIVAFFVSKTLSGSLIKLKNAANKIANGNFDVRTNIRTKDEIGELSFAFDSMAKRLQDSIIEIKDKDEVIKQQEDILLQFSDYSENYAVCMVDIVNSTKLTSKLSESETSEFYKIFLNSMATIVRDFKGIVVKNIGDALLFYFPVLESEEKLVLKRCLDCCLTISEGHEEIVKKLKEKDLPLFDYRISATYGMVRIAKTSTSSVNDIFGITVNKCAKINRSASINGLIIGEEFYKNVKTFDKNYFFKKIESELVSPEHGYTGYRVSRKTTRNNLENN